MGDVVAEGVAALQTPILQVGNPALPSMGVTASGYVREAQANNNGTQGGDCNVQCCLAQARQPQSTENPFVWWRTQSVAVVVAVMVVAMANRTGRYASQWRRRARDEHSVFGIKL